MRPGRVAAAMAAATWLCAWPAPRAAGQIRIQFITPEERVAELFVSRDYAGAAAYLEEHLARWPDDRQMLYNLACARSRLGEIDAAAGLLMRAVKAGFNDFSHMRRDDDLAAMRSHRTFVTLMAALAAADDMIARRQLELCLESTNREFYAVDCGSLPGITVAAPMSGPIETQWLARRVREHLDVVSQSLFDGKGLEQRINILLASDEDGTVLLSRRHAGGVYRHNQRMLIAIDAGTCLRHELVHALHQSDMDRRGQQHPLWIEEGLALLFEDCMTDWTGEIRFPPTERDNIARVLAREERLIPWSTLMVDDGVVASEPTRSYAQLRSMMRFFDEEFGVRAWYSAYTESFESDPSGIGSIEMLARERLDNLESKWKRWLASQPAVVGSSFSQSLSRRAMRSESAQSASPRPGDPVEAPASAAYLPPLAW